MIVDWYRLSCYCNAGFRCAITLGCVILLGFRCAITLGRVILLGFRCAITLGCVILLGLRCAINRDATVLRCFCRFDGLTQLFIDITFGFFFGATFAAAVDSVALCRVFWAHGGSGHTPTPRRYA